MSWKVTNSCESEVLGRSDVIAMVRITRAMGGGSWGLWTMIQQCRLGQIRLHAYLPIPGFTLPTPGWRNLYKSWGLGCWSHGGCISSYLLWRCTVWEMKTWPHICSFNGSFQSYSGVNWMINNTNTIFIIRLKCQWRQRKYDQIWFYSPLKAGSHWHLVLHNLQ